MRDIDIARRVGRRSNKTFRGLDPQGPPCLYPKLDYPQPIFLPRSIPFLEAPSSGGEAASAAQQQRLPDRKSRCWSIWVERVNRLVSDMKQRTGIEVSIRSASEFLDILEFLRRSGRNQAAMLDHDHLFANDNDNACRTHHRKAKKASLV